MINKLILETLRPLNIPIAFQIYLGTKQPDGKYKIVYPYVTFSEYLQMGESFSDDEEDSTGHYIQVDVWSKEDYTSIVTQVKSLMLQKEFKRTDEVDLYESDTQIYHKGIRFFYQEQII